MCHICVKTGQRECDPAAAEIKCAICNRCEAERQEREAVKNALNEE